MDVVGRTRPVVIDDRADLVEMDPLTGEPAGQRRLHHGEYVFQSGEGHYGVCGKEERRRQQRIGAVFLGLKEQGVDVAHRAPGLTDAPAEGHGDGQARDLADLLAGQPCGVEAWMFQTVATVAFDGQFRHGVVAQCMHHAYATGHLPAGSVTDDAVDRLAVVGVGLQTARAVLLLLKAELPAVDFIADPLGRLDLFPVGPDQLKEPAKDVGQCRIAHGSPSPPAAGFFTNTDQRVSFLYPGPDFHGTGSHLSIFFPSMTVIRFRSQPQCRGVFHAVRGDGRHPCRGLRCRDLRKERIGRIVPIHRSAV